MPTLPVHDPALDARIKAAGASKTVYALVTPETEAAKTAILGSTMPAPDAVRRHHLEQFRDAWTGKQFALHEQFLDRWREWAAPVAEIRHDVFAFGYPTAGASEALFHLISGYGNRARRDGFVPRIHIFAGEYEGYRAYGEACQIEIVEHLRAGWAHVPDAMRTTDLFMLSQPSAIDGNVWQDANAFLRLLDQPGVPPRVVLDLTYVGAVADAPDERIAASTSAVAAVVFSLSKPFGVYYDRIGGVYTRTAQASLFGHQWFKNITSLQLGSELIGRWGVFDLPRRYKDVQRSAVRAVGGTLGLDLEPSDVVVLATAPATGDAALDGFLRRPACDPNARLRLCLTPSMAARIGTAGSIGID